MAQTEESRLRRARRVVRRGSVLLATPLCLAIGCSSLETQHLGRLMPARNVPSRTGSNGLQAAVPEQIKATSRGVAHANSGFNQDAVESQPGSQFAQTLGPNTYGVQQANFESGSSSQRRSEAVRLASCTTEASCSHGGSCAACAQSCGPTGACLRPAGTQFIDPQEYLFDGGDRDPAVIVQDDWRIKGLQPEDTVAHYETIDGKQCVVATNRVPIYAPRFAAVRKITGTISSESSIGAKPLLSPNAAALVRETGLAGTVAVPVGPKAEESVKLIDAFRDRNRGVPADSVLPPVPVSDALAPIVNLNFFRTGLLDDAESAVLGRVLANARVWNIPESLAVLLDGKEAIERKDRKSANELLIYEAPPGKCSMRICKAASHSIADPGDVIHFTIRFDNVGPSPIGNAVIVDSLSSRLEYVDGSQQCNLKTKFTTSENEAGSSVLRWEISAPLAAGEGGTLHFRCRVR